MTATVMRGDARSIPLADNTVDLVVTSPPYFGLRSYTDGGEHYAGQIGAEPTPAEFVDALVDVTRECMRVLKPTGSLWVNLGDKYAGNGGGGIGSSDGTTGRGPRPPRFDVGIPTKSLMGIPWRYALRCIDGLGLILRAEVIWSKPNGLPESVTDRVRRSHEQWFHFTLSPRYYSAVDEIREGYEPDATARRLRYGANLKSNGRGTAPETRARGGTQERVMGFGNPDNINPLGKLPGSVWSVPTQPLTVPASLGVDHFAAFPMEWPRRIIRGWSPAGVCTACGEGRRPVAIHEAALTQAVSNAQAWPSMGGRQGARKRVDVTLTGRYACACPDTTAPTRPSVVLDPFGGTGTTALVADTLGRHGITLDASADYCRLAEWRTTDPAQRASAMQVDKPAAQLDGQLDLLGEAL